MNITEFCEKVIKQDKRNIFKSFEGSVDKVSEPLQEFYRKSNPIDVEITMNGNPIKFYPYNELEDLQADYELEGETFVFATCNSDPIFICKGKIYTCCHGSKKANFELMADEFSDFLGLID